MGSWWLRGARARSVRIRLRDLALSAGWVELTSRPFAILSLCPTPTLSASGPIVAFRIHTEPQKGRDALEGIVRLPYYFPFLSERRCMLTLG